MMTQALFPFEAPMNQLPLLSKAPASRSTDNAASYRAEERITKSGKRAADQWIVREAVSRYPGMTSKELAQITGLCRYMLGRRLPELLPVHVTRLNSPQGWRWYAKELVS